MSTIHSVRNLQSLLAKQQQDKVNQVGGQPVEKQHVDVVVQFVGGDASVWIPETRFHRVSVPYFLTHFDYFAPLHLPVVSARDIVYRHVLRPLRHLGKLVGDHAQSVDGVVHRNNLGQVARVNQHRSDDTFAGAHHQPGGSVKVVHPSRDGLVRRRRHWACGR